MFCDIWRCLGMFWDVWNINQFIASLFINKFQLVLRMMQYCIMLSWAWVGIADVFVCFGMFLDVFWRFRTFLDVLLQSYQEAMALAGLDWPWLGLAGLEQGWSGLTFAQRIMQRKQTIASCLARLGLAWLMFWDVLGRFRTSWDFLDVFGRFWMFYRVSKLDKREIKRLLGHQKCTLKL